MTSTPAALRSAIFRSISANRYGGMASMRRAVGMGWVLLLAWRSGSIGRSGDQQPTVRGPPLRSPVRRVHRSGRFGSADPELAVADPGQGALGASPLGPVDEVDDLAPLGLRDRVRTGQDALVGVVLARAGDELDQVGLGREPLAVAGGVAEQQPGQLGLGVDRPVLGQTVIEDQDVVHGARTFAQLAAS